MPGFAGAVSMFGDGQTPRKSPSNPNGHQEIHAILFFLDDCSREDWRSSLSETHRIFQERRLTSLVRMVPIGASSWNTRGRSSTSRQRRSKATSDHTRQTRAFEALSQCPKQPKMRSRSSGMARTRRVALPYIECFVDRIRPVLWVSY